MATVGNALWSGDEAALARLADQHGCASFEDTEARLNVATTLRAQLKHIPVPCSTMKVSGIGGR